VVALFRFRIKSLCKGFKGTCMHALRLLRILTRVALQVSLPRDRSDPDPRQLIAGR
jgi:hypothetical protein